MTRADRAATGPRGFSTGWAWSSTARAVRNLVQVAAIGPLVKAELSLDVHSPDELAGLPGHALVVANHASRLDAAVLLATLPAGWRRRTALAVGTDFDSWRRAGGSALLAAGWHVLVFPEGSRSRDGHLGRFDPGVAAFAAATGVPVVPVGIRGTYAAMPRGRRWPVRGRPRVAVRYGLAMAPADGEPVGDFATRVQQAVQRLVDEDATSWWQTQRVGTGPAEPAAASWRRIWRQSEEPVAGGQSRRPRIWRP